MEKLKTLIIDNFLPENHFISLKNRIKHSFSEKWFNLSDVHENLDLCKELLFECKKHYDLISCVGYEMWINHNRRPPDWHYDKDEKLYDIYGVHKYPICSMVYYVKVKTLNGGNLVLENSIIFPVENRLVIFPPGVFHYVEDFTGDRVSILINPWSSKPLSY